MSTRPPLPPQLNWPNPTLPNDAAGDDDDDDGGGGGRQEWWTGERVVAAIVIVLVLMGGVGFAGFLAGAAWSGVQSFETVAEDVSEGATEDVAEGVAEGATEDVTEGATGGDLSVDVPEEAEAVDGETLRVGDTVTGTLTDGSVDHPLSLETAGEVTIEVRSDDFDTIVAVLDEDGNQVAENDDIEFGENRNSRVDVSLPAGTHTVVVDAFGFEGGAYELSASS